MKRGNVVLEWSEKKKKRVAAYPYVSRWMFLKIEKKTERELAIWKRTIKGGGKEKEKGRVDVSRGHGCKVEIKGEKGTETLRHSNAVPSGEKKKRHRFCRRRVCRGYGTGQTILIKKEKREPKLN